MYTRKKSKKPIVAIGEWELGGRSTHLHRLIVCGNSVKAVYERTRQRKITAVGHEPILELGEVEEVGWVVYGAEVVDDGIKTWLRTAIWQYEELGRLLQWAAETYGKKS